MSIKFVYISFVASLLIVFAHIQKVSHPDLHNPAFIPGNEWRSDIDSLAQNLVDRKLVPGIGIAVTHADSIIYVGGFGIANSDKNIPVTDKTYFYIASSTKALTATAIVLKADRGELDLNAPITAYLPDILFKSPVNASKLTVRDFLTMQEGISCRPVVFRTAYTGDFTYSKLYELMSDCGPGGSPDTFNYDNFPYNVLGMILDPVHDHGWKKVVRKEVLEPLNMHETTAHISTVDSDRIAMPHRAVPDKGFNQIRLKKEDKNLHAAGGHFTTPRDLAKYVAAHASNGKYEGNRVFPEKPIRSSHQKQIEQDRTFGPYKRIGWGYGWDLGIYEGQTIVHRFGGFTGYRSHMSFMPKSKLGVIVLINGYPPFAVDQIANYIYDRLTGRIPMEELEKIYDRQIASEVDIKKRIMERERKKIEDLRNRESEPLHPLESYAGVYENSLYGQLTYKIVNDRLEVTMGAASSKVQTYDAENNAFHIRLTGRDTIVEFEFKQGEDKAYRVTTGNGIIYNRID